jgi:hypothetical protein
MFFSLVIKCISNLIILMQLIITIILIIILNLYAQVFYGF